MHLKQFSAYGMALDAAGDFDVHLGDRFITEADLSHEQATFRIDAMTLVAKRWLGRG